MKWGILVGITGLVGLCALLAFFFPWMDYSGAERYCFRLRLIDASGPIVGAEVSVLNAAGNLNPVGTTDAAGTVEFIALASFGGSENIFGVNIAEGRSEEVPLIIAAGNRSVQRAILLKGLKRIPSGSYFAPRNMEVPPADRELVEAYVNQVTIDLEPAGQ